MREIKWEHFCKRKCHGPFRGVLELTYRCNLNCVHCYCKGSEDDRKELSLSEWKSILDEIRARGCLYIIFTGGEPLIREDFVELFSYAKKRGFIISIFTNGQALKNYLDFLRDSPPFSIEITLNGITKSTYESVTQIEGSFEKVMDIIKEIKERSLPLVLKTNLLRQNKNEIREIKAFADRFLGKGRFRYDPMIFPRLNGDTAPCQYRLSFREISEIRRQDQDIWKEYHRGLHSDTYLKKRDGMFLYQCNSWRRQFFVNPYGRLKFCQFSEKFSVDLKRGTFEEGFYNMFPKVLDEKFQTHSRCRDCKLRPICYYCPGRAYLETGKEEGPVRYYCTLAKSLKREIESLSETQVL